MSSPVPFEVLVTLTVPADSSSADGMSSAMQQRLREAFARELDLDASEVLLSVISATSSDGAAADADATGSSEAVVVVVEARVVLVDEEAAVQAKRDLDTCLGTVEEAAAFFGGAVRPTEVPLVEVAPAADGKVVEESRDEISSPAPGFLLSLDAPTLAAFAACGGLLLLFLCCALRAAAWCWGRVAVRPTTNRVKPLTPSPSSPSLPEPAALATQVSRLEILTSTDGAVKLAQAVRTGVHARRGGRGVSSGHIELRDEVHLDLGTGHPPAPPAPPQPTLVKGLSKLLPQQLGARKASGTSSSGSCDGRKGSGLSKQGSSGMLGVLSRQGSSKSYSILDKSDAGDELTTAHALSTLSGPHLGPSADVSEHGSVGSSADAPSMRRDGGGGAERSYGDWEDSSETAAVRHFI